jgi:hypothetical protein
MVQNSHKNKYAGAGPEPPPRCPTPPNWTTRGFGSKTISGLPCVLLCVVTLPSLPGSSRISHSRSGTPDGAGKCRPTRANTAPRSPSDSLALA